MGMTTETLPEIVVARTEYVGGVVHLILEDKDRVMVKFQLHPMALALLELTNRPTMQLALADLKQKYPDASSSPSAPDTAEGLEG